MTDVHAVHDAPLTTVFHCCSASVCIGKKTVFFDDFFTQTSRMEMNTIHTAWEGTLSVSPYLGVNIFPNFPSAHFSSFPNHCAHQKTTILCKALTFPTVHALLPNWNHFCSAALFDVVADMDGLFGGRV